MTWLIVMSHAYASTANIPMLYLLVVIAAALFLGRTAAVLAAVAASLSFDFFFISPQYQFTVQDPQEWVALCIFLLVAIVTAQLTALLHARAEESQRRKLETAALAEASWTVASELDRDRALNKILSKLVDLVKPDAAQLLVADSESGYKVLARYSSGDCESGAVNGIAGDAVRFVLANGQAIGWQPSEHWRKALRATGGAVAAYLPVVVESQVLAVLYVKLKDEQVITEAETQLVDSLRNHAAVILLRDKLMKADARAQALAEADRLKTALLSMVSHDFRSPLTSIKASVSSLLEVGRPVAPEDQSALLQGVVAETDRLDRMVGNILDLSRLESGAWQPRKELTPVTELIGAALDYFSADENRRIQVVLDKGVPEIAVDEVQMVQVLKNLLENALKYSFADSIVELKANVDGGNFVMAVLDRGPGLPKGEEQRVFEPFYRAPVLSESAVPGVGIGLALCRGLVEANGGELTTANRSGGGATFRVSLPLDSSAHDGLSATGVDMGEGASQAK